ncbi:MAG: hypothetical protein IT430_11550 [Phycisphaerales bacterium]|nr:hypothetical protein [Phycisphaerales bacterium]
MTHKLTMANVCLHISAAVYALFAGLMWSFSEVIFEDDPEYAGVVGAALSVFCIALIIGIEFVAWGIRRRKFWAWIAGLCIFGIYLPSLFLPLGAFGLWGLLDRGSRAEFGVG